MGKLVDEAKKKEAAEAAKPLQKVEIEYLKGKFGPVDDKPGKRDLVMKFRADQLVKKGVAKIVKLMILLLGLSAGLFAQDFTIYTPGNAPTLIISDTIDDTESNDTTVLIKLPHNEPLGLSVHVIAANISGTTDIDVSYEASNDGTNFYAVATDSLASGNLQYIHEDIDGWTARYLRVTRTGVGTQSTKVTGYLYVFKIPGK